MLTRQLRSGLQKRKLLPQQKLNERRPFAVVGVSYLFLVTSSADGLASAGATVHVPDDTAAAAAAVPCVLVSLGTLVLLRLGAAANRPIQNSNCSCNFCGLLCGRTLALPRLAKNKCEQRAP